MLGGFDSVVHYLTVNDQSESNPDCNFLSSIASFASERSNHQSLLTLSQYSQNSSHHSKYNQYSVKIMAEYQTIWINDQARSFVGPDLDMYCLKIVFNVTGV